METNEGWRETEGRKQHIFRKRLTENIYLDCPQNPSTKGRFSNNHSIRVYCGGKYDSLGTVSGDSVEVCCGLLEWIFNLIDGKLELFIHESKRIIKKETSYSLDGLTYSEHKKLSIKLKEIRED